MISPTEYILVRIIEKECAPKQQLTNLCKKNAMWEAIGKGKVKAIPLQVWKGPEGSRSLRHPDFKTIGTSRW